MLSKKHTKSGKITTWLILEMWQLLKLQQLCAIPVELKTSKNSGNLADLNFIIISILW